MLTVREGFELVLGIGREKATGAVIEALSGLEQPVVFILWFGAASRLLGRFRDYK